MSVNAVDEQKKFTTINTLTNATELASAIAMEVLNKAFSRIDGEVPTLDAVRDVTIQRIKTNHNL